MNKLFLIKFSPEMVKVALNTIIQDMVAELFSIGDMRGIIFWVDDLDKKNSFHAKCIFWQTDSDDSDTTGFSITQEQLQDSFFLTKYLQKILDEKSIKTDYLYKKISNEKLIEIIKRYLLGSKIKGLPKKNRKILNVSFLKDLDFYKCIAVMATSKRIKYPIIDEVDKMIDYTDEDELANLFPHVIEY